MFVVIFGAKVAIIVQEKQKLIAQSPRSNEAKAFGSFYRKVIVITVMLTFSFVVRSFYNLLFSWGIISSFFSLSNYWLTAESFFFLVTEWVPSVLTIVIFFKNSKVKVQFESVQQP